MAAKRIIDIATGILTTTDATQTTIISFPVPSGSSGIFEVNIVGRDTSSGDTVVTEQKAAAKNIAGTVSVVGSIVNVVALTADTALLTASATMTASGGNLLIKVTGVAAKTINWFAELKAWLS